VKWFRHMAVSHQDSKISRLLDSSGLAGYGAWWIVLEIIAGEMGKEDRKCSADHSLTRWSRFLGCHHNKAKSYLRSMQSAGLVDLEIIEDRYRVSVHNLLKYRDEYARKSGHAPESVRTHSAQIRTYQSKAHQSTAASPPSREENQSLNGSGDERDSTNEKMSPVSEAVLEVMEKTQRAGFVSRA
jgi:hypothetical protein